VILLPASVRIYVATAPTNLRKSFEGLSNEVRSALAADPISGHVFLFLNRKRSQVKLLVWTRGGFTIVHNQPSSYYTSFGSKGGSCSYAQEARMAAARSASRSQRLLCFAGRFGSSS
jgi:hypothetical protein